MAGYMSGRMKRKDLEEVADEFSEFSLSSPARKMRRLNAELPPIMEEEESGVPFDVDQVLPKEQTFSAQVLEEDISEQEKALVLYKPINTPLLIFPNSSNFSITVNSDLIPRFKDHRGFCSGKRTFLEVDNSAEFRRYENTSGNDKCLAVVPWVSSRFSSTSGRDLGAAATSTATTTNGIFSEPMEAEEESQNVDMEIEMDNNMGIFEGKEQHKSLGLGGGLQQWTQQQQQHCINLPQLPQNRSTPIMWSW